MQHWEARRYPSPDEAKHGLEDRQEDGEDESEHSCHGYVRCNNYPRGEELPVAGGIKPLENMGMATWNNTRKTVKLDAE